VRPETAAQWMLDELERRGELDQMDSVDGIIKNFDDQSDHRAKGSPNGGKDIEDAALEVLRLEPAGRFRVIDQLLST